MNRLVIVILFSAHLSAGCENEWPPIHSEATTLFQDIRPLFVEVEKEMISDGLEHLPVAFDLVRERQQKDPLQRPLTDDEKQKYARILKGRTAFRIEHLGGTDFYFETLHEDRKNQYRVVYFHNADISNLANCELTLSHSKCGTCRAELGEGWAVQYVWIPLDMDGWTDSELESCRLQTLGVIPAN